MHTYDRQIVTKIMNGQTELFSIISFVGAGDPYGLRFRIIPHDAEDVFKVANLFLNACPSGYAQDPDIHTNDDRSISVTIYPD